MIKSIDALKNLKEDSKVNYSYFRGLLFKGYDDEHVTLQDKNGEKRRIYTSLFLKYGEIL